MVAARGYRQSTPIFCTFCCLANRTPQRNQLFEFLHDRIGNCLTIRATCTDESECTSYYACTSFSWGEFYAVPVLSAVQIPFRFDGNRHLGLADTVYEPTQRR